MQRGTVHRRRCVPRVIPHGAGCTAVRDAAARGARGGWGGRANGPATESPSSLPTRVTHAHHTARPRNPTQMKSVSKCLVLARLYARVRTQKLVLLRLHGGWRHGVAQADCWLVSSGLYSRHWRPQIQKRCEAGGRTQRRSSHPLTNVLQVRQQPRAAPPPAPPTRVRVGAYVCEHTCWRVTARVQPPAPRHERCGRRHAVEQRCGRRRGR